MAQISRVLRSVAGGHSHWCPGCGEMHVIPSTWDFDHNLDAPTFSPSVKIDGLKTIKVDGVWHGEWERDREGKPIPFVCHYVLTAGVLNYCADSTHALAGQSVPLPPIPDHLKD